MPATVTVTGVVGPGITATATVFSDVATFTINCYQAEVLVLTFSDGRPPAYIAIDSATTITVTVSGQNYTVSIS